MQGDLHDQAEVGEPGRARRDQDASCRFRSVCRRTQAIESERRQPFGDAYLARAAFLTLPAARPRSKRRENGL